MADWEAPTFAGQIAMLMQQKDLGRADLIRKAGLSRTYGYQILDGSRMPGKDKVIQLALAMELDLCETNRLLSLSGNSSLYARKKADAIVIHCLFRHLDVMACSELLYQEGLPVLGE